MVAHRFIDRAAVVRTVDDLPVARPFFFGAGGVGHLIARADDKVTAAFLDDLKRTGKVLFRMNKIGVFAAVFKIDMDIGEGSKAVAGFCIRHRRLLSRYGSLLL